MSNYQINNSRYEKRDKRRKTNVVLNTLIGLVFVLILVIGSQLIFGDSGAEKTAKYNEQPDIKLASEENKAEQDDSNEKTAENDDKSEDKDLNEDEGIEEEAKEDEETEEDSFEQATITEGEPGSEIAETIENPAWSPIGTSQTEPHSANYTKGSQDWNEMTKALSYATGIPESDMIIWFLGNNGGPNDAAGTISPKDKSVKYKVYITWVENNGWKPTKIEKLN
ncbi:YrrS family protein [Metabacillus litoralis]|uniref:YrrS family protein n=1 Tax=Metabacillus litoralis TaxID=152268 RepID=UPI001EFFED93|nr:YrrS family protein [Metabacillus litoralis]